MTGSVLLPGKHKDGHDDKKRPTVLSSRAIAAN